MSLLKQLREMTVVVADTGDIEAIGRYTPQDATTNPSLIYNAAQMARYRPLVDQAIDWAKDQDLAAEARMEACLDRLAVNFGLEIL